MHSWRVAIIVVAFVSLKACGPPAEEKASGQTRIEQMDAQTSAEQKSIEISGTALTRARELSPDAFQYQLSSCNSEEEISHALFNQSMRGMSPQGNPRRAGFAERSLMEGSDGKRVFAIAVEFSPGDPGIISRNIDYYVIGSDCRYAYIATDYDV